MIKIELNYDIQLVSKNWSQWGKPHFRSVSGQSSIGGQTVLFLSHTRPEGSLTGDSDVHSSLGATHHGFDSFSLYMSVEPALFITFNQFRSHLVLFKTESFRRTQALVSPIVVIFFLIFHFYFLRQGLTI